MTPPRRSAADLRDARTARAAVPAAAPPVPERTYRQTVDLPAAQHVALTTWRTRMAAELGRSRLTTQDVLSACVTALLDGMTAEQVEAVIRATPERRRRSS